MRDAGCLEGGGGWVETRGGVYIHATCPVVVIERPARDGIASFASWRLRCGGFFPKGGRQTEGLECRFRKTAG